MRTRYIAVLLFLVAVAGGSWYVITSGLYRSGLDRARSIVYGIPSPPGRNSSRSPFENSIRERLLALEISPSSIHETVSESDSTLIIRSPVPQGKPIEWIVWHLSEATNGSPYSVADCNCSADTRNCTLRFAAKPPRHRPVTLLLRRSSSYAKGSAKLAIVVADFDFLADQTTIEYLSFPHALTLAILPSRRLSEQTARISNEYKKETVILLPMEPAVREKGKGDYGPVIMVHYPETRVKAILNDAVSMVPTFAGFANYGGGRILPDSRIMGIVLSECRRRGAYFLEFPATRKSLGAPFARKHGVPQVTINHMIDTTQAVTAIVSALLHYGEEAQKKGTAIIGTPKSGRFLDALKKADQKLSQQGIILTYVSDIIAQCAADKKE